MRPIVLKAAAAAATILVLGCLGPVCDCWFCYTNANLSVIYQNAHHLLQSALAIGNGKSVWCFAYKWVDGFVICRLPVHLHEVMMKARKAEKELLAEMRREPTKAEIATKIGITEQRLHELNKVSCSLNCTNSLL